MTKDGIADKIGSVLRKLYDRTAQEPVPADMTELLAKLK